MAHRDYEREGTVFGRDNRVYTFRQFRGNPHDDNGAYSSLSIMISLIASQTVTHSLYNLATHPEYVQPLREEIEAVIQEQGWSKASVANMTKLDSFVKETMRLSPIAACTYLIWYSHLL